MLLCIPSSAMLLLLRYACSCAMPALAPCLLLPLCLLLRYTCSCAMPALALGLLLLCSQTSMPQLADAILFSTNMRSGVEMPGDVDAALATVRLCQHDNTVVIACQQLSPPRPSSPACWYRAASRHANSQGHCAAGQPAPRAQEEDLQDDIAEKGQQRDRRTSGVARLRRDWRLETGD